MNREEDFMRDLGSLKNCLMEGEEGAGLRSPRRRRIALLLSSCLQFLMLALLVLAPLLVKGERLQRTRIQVPGPIVHLERVPPQQDPRPASEQPTNRRPPIGDAFPPFVAPPRIPERIGNPNDTDLAPAPDFSSVGPHIPGSIPIPDLNAPHGRPPIPDAPIPPPAERQKVAVSEGVQAARLIHRVEPVYPPLARQIRLEGTVVLRALIGTHGAVREVQLVSGHPLLVHAALDAVAQWRYQPTLLNGQPVEVETRITVIFILNR